MVRHGIRSLKNTSHRCLIMILFQDTAVVVKKFMARDPENLNFTVVALAAKPK